MGRGGGLTIDLVLVGIFFLSMFCLSVGFFFGWEFGVEIIVIFLYWL